MTTVRQRILERLVTLYETHKNPVTTTELARQLDVRPSIVDDHLHSLEQCELLKESVEGMGYEPTITAHELLALDLGEDGLVVVDCEEES